MQGIQVEGEKEAVTLKIGDHLVIDPGQAVGHFHHFFIIMHLRQRVAENYRNPFIRGYMLRGHCQAEEKAAQFVIVEGQIRFRGEAEEFFEGLFILSGKHCQRGPVKVLSDWGGGYSNSGKEEQKKGKNQTGSNNLGVALAE
jgi:hypothetical protein